MVTEGKPLTPLTHGSVLIVGTMPSNFGDEIKNHPRVIMWGSQQQHWLNKSLPDNTQAVFITRFIGHDAFDNILTEARKRRITIFNPTGTGIIAKQVKELLNINPVQKTEPTIEPKTEPKEVEVAKRVKTGEKGKLNALIPFIDFSKTNIDNARNTLIDVANEKGITTTVQSIAQFVMKQREKSKAPKSPAHQAVSVKVEKTDAVIQMFDNIIQEMKDMRAYVVETTKENNSLRAKLASLKKALD